MDDIPALECQGISKFFPETGTLANDGISLRLNAGEIHAVVGENGAGKSTLARILAGLDRPDYGEMRVRGKVVRFLRPRDAERWGIGMVPQHSLLASGLTVAENVILGHEPRFLKAFVDFRKAYYKTAMASAQFRFPLNPGAVVESLSPPERRLAEIVRALARGGDILILDEPTSILTESEAVALFDLLGSLRDAGTAILLISHRVREVLASADRITVLRNGVVAETLKPSETDECDLARRMASATSCFSPDGPVLSEGQAVFSFRVTGVPEGPRDGLSSLDFQVRRGEIYGIAALAGNGLGTLEDLASGERFCSEGSVQILGRDVGDWPRAQLRASVLSYLPTDRDGKGLCLDASILENMAARGFLERSWNRSGRRESRDEASFLLTRAGVGADPDTPVRLLSGGNRQRVLNARELGAFRPAVLAANPTQGLDTRSQEETWNRLRELSRQGAAVLLLTSSVDELFSVADRIGVLYRGRLTEMGLRGEGITAEAVTARMTGAAA